MLREYAGLTTKREVLKAEMHGITHHPVRCKKELRLCIELALTQQLVLRISARDSSARCALAMCSLFQCADHAVHLVLQRGHVMNQLVMRPPLLAADGLHVYAAHAPDESFGGLAAARTWQFNARAALHLPVGDTAIHCPVA